MRTRLRLGSVTWSRLLTSQGLPLGKWLQPPGLAQSLQVLYSSRLSSPKSHCPLTLLSSAAARFCFHVQTLFSEGPSADADLTSSSSTPARPPQPDFHPHLPRRLCEVTGDLNPCHQLHGQF